jgi:RNA polymerase-associated protein
MDFEIRDIDLYHKPEDINILNPYGEVPILVERDLVLYEANIINEYIDERFPHPQLMPPDPVMRSRVRLVLFNFEREIFSHVRVLEDKTSSEKDKDKARDVLRGELTKMAPIVQRQKYLFGDDFTMLDIALAPLLWRLQYYKINLPASAMPIQKYAERVFSRPAYIEALTPSERVMRK